MKIVIDQGDGFSLSPLAMKKLAAAQEVSLFFYTEEGNDIVRITEEQAARGEYTYILTENAGERLPEVQFFQEQSRYPVFDSWHFERNDPLLVQLVEEMGEGVNAWGSQLKVVEIPDDVEWEIGYKEIKHGTAAYEYIYEKHRTWE